MFIYPAAPSCIGRTSGCFEVQVRKPHVLMGYRKPKKKKSAAHAQVQRCQYRNRQRVCHWGQAPGGTRNKSGFAQSAKEKIHLPAGDARHVPTKHMWVWVLPLHRSGLGSERQTKLFCTSRHESTFSDSTKTRTVLIQIFYMPPK